MASAADGLTIVANGSGKKMSAHETYVGLKKLIMLMLDLDVDGLLFVPTPKLEEWRKSATRSKVIAFQTMVLNSLHRRLLQDFKDRHAHESCRAVAKLLSQVVQNLSSEGASGDGLANEFIGGLTPSVESALLACGPPPELDQMLTQSWRSAALPLFNQRYPQATVTLVSAAEEVNEHVVVKLKAALILSEALPLLTLANEVRAQYRKKTTAAKHAEQVLTLTSTAKQILTMTPLAEKFKQACARCLPSLEATLLEAFTDKLESNLAQALLEQVCTLATAVWEETLESSKKLKELEINGKVQALVENEKLDKPEGAAEEETIRKLIDAQTSRRFKKLVKAWHSIVDAPRTIGNSLGNRATGARFALGSFQKIVDSEGRTAVKLQLGEMAFIQSALRKLRGDEETRTDLLVQAAQCVAENDVDLMLPSYIKKILSSCPEAVQVLKERNEKRKAAQSKCGRESSRASTGS